jgi:outer membrane receptor for monomeric catechols
MIFLDIYHSSLINKRIDLQKPFYGLRDTNYLRKVKKIMHPELKKGLMNPRCIRRLSSNIMP